MMKLFNSIRFYGISDNVICQSYNKHMYDLIQNDSTFKAFDFLPSIGMSLYSKKYDVFIGGIRFHANSIIFLDTKTLNEDSRQILRDFIGTHKD